MTKYFLYKSKTHQRIQKEWLTFSIITETATNLPPHYFITHRQPSLRAEQDLNYARELLCAIQSARSSQLLHTKALKALARP